MKLIRSSSDFTVLATTDDFVKNNVILKAVDHNSLDRTFKLFCPNAEDSLLNEEFDGKDMPRLFKEYKESGDEEYLNAILSHNQNCIKKTMYLYNAFIGNDLVSPLSIPTSRL